MNMFHYVMYLRSSAVVFISRWLGSSFTMRPGLFETLMRGCRINALGGLVMFFVKPVAISSYRAFKVRRSFFLHSYK